MDRRDFLGLLAAAAAAGLPLDRRMALAADDSNFYELPPFGNVGLLHFTDCHAQLLPLHYREPELNIGVGAAAGRPPHITGEALLRHFGISPGTATAHAFSSIDFAAAGEIYGKTGGFAHLATLVKRLRADRPGALLLDGGDSWQGSATSLWTQGRDMIEACIELGVDAMTAHWEFTYGAQRVEQALAHELDGRIAFLAQNVRTRDFGDPVFDSHVIREVNGVAVAIIGQAFPYTPIANPGHLIPDWSFGIREVELQALVNRIRNGGVRVIVLLSHNGLDVDLKLASRVTGIDAILGGHTHDAVPTGMMVQNAGGKTLVTNGGSNGKFLGVLDLDVRAGSVAGFRYRLLPIFSRLLPADAAMSALIEKVRAPFEQKLAEPLAVTEGMLYRRGNFNGTFDQLVLDALLEAGDAQIAFSPGFRWGTTMLPGESITREDVMEQTAITYPSVTSNELSGSQIKAILEDVCDNLFNPDPYYQQGGDMVRVGGLSYACAPNAAMGSRISELRLDGKALDPDRRYKVAGWASVAEDVSGEAVWDVVERWLRDKKTIAPIKPNVPRLIGVEGNPGIS